MQKDPVRQRSSPLHYVVPLTHVHISRRYGKAVIYFASNWRFITYDSAGIPGDDRALYGATGRWRGQWSITLGPREIDTILGLLLDMVCHDLRTLSDDDASSSLQVENASEENLQFIGPI